MKYLKSMFPVLLFLALVTTGLLAQTEVPSSSAALAEGPLTVGDFALQVARLTAENSDELNALNAEAALASLTRAGLEFKTSSEEPITEEEISRFFRQMGLTLQVTNPDKPVSAGKASALLSAFSGFVSSRAADPAKSLRAVPTRSIPSFQIENGIEECFINRGNTKECKECCLAAGGTNKACGRSCGQARAGKASAVDPTP